LFVFRHDAKNTAHGLKFLLKGMLSEGKFIIFNPVDDFIFRLCATINII
jgi:hypothetical protein